jgi:methionyl-tRNA synthetase
MEKKEITIEEFLEIESKLEIRIGIINGATRIPKSYGLELVVQFEDVDENGDEINFEKTAFTNLGRDFEPEDLIGIQCPFIMNLAPTIIKGVNSEVMIMVAEHHERGLIINPNDYIYGAKLL